MVQLYVAAGGGGDALASAILHSLIGGSDEPAVVATFAWDRFVVDPLPGPRSIQDFENVTFLGPRTWQITENTRPISPAGSALPRLAAEISATLILLDPSQGACGLAEQVRAAVDLFQPDHVNVIDVGGDVVARGDEAEVRSPMADCLALAACADLPVATTVTVMGPGVDGELSEGYVLDRIKPNGQRLLRLRPTDVDPFRSIFEWHPSEATALWAAASSGLRGVVEVRGGGVYLTVTDHSADVYRCSHAAVFDAGLLARALVDTTSLAQAEEVTRRVCGFCETDRERRIAAATIHPATTTPKRALVQQRIFEATDAARERGVDFLTFRRLAEAVGLVAGQYEWFRKDLIRRWPERYTRGLWSV